MRSRALVATALALGLAVGTLTGTTTGAVAGPVGGAVVNVTPPTTSGEPAFGSRLTADPGTWSPADATYTYQWLRDGDPIDGADGQHFRPRVKDIEHEVQVEVTASADGATDGTATSDSVTVTKGTLVSEKRPTIDGQRRFGHTLVARAGTWDRKPDRLRFQWLRNDKVVKGARGVATPSVSRTSASG